MILYSDGHPTRRRYSVGFVGSILFHVAIVVVVLSQASAMRPANSSTGGSGSTGRHTPRDAAALLRSGEVGGDPTGMMGATPTPMEEPSWPVRQAERFGLRIGIGWAIDHIWQSTLFAVAIGLLTLAFRRNRARVRYALWFSASLKFLLPFSAMVWAGSAIGSTIGPLIGPGALGAFAKFGAAGAQGASGSAGGVGQWLAATGTAALWPSTFTIDEVTAAWLGLALLGIWTFGFVAIIASRVRRSRQIWDVALSSRRVELVDVKVPARLQVGMADGLLEPGVIGWLNPVLLMPADIERHLTRPELEAIVAHELCHVRRFDNMTAAIHMLVEAIFWFHPLVWWLGARLLDERERACDEHVLASTGAPGPYAQGILNVCKRYVASPLASVSGVGSANVRQRIDAILANRIGEATAPWKRVMLSAIILCVVIAPLAAGALHPLPPRATPRAAASAGVPTIPAYALVVAQIDGRLGPELRQVGTAVAAANGDRPAFPTVRPREIASEAMTMPRLAALLSSIIGRDVEDRTGLPGDFTVRLVWTSHPSGPSLADAMKQQLGLRLTQVPAATP